MDGKTFNPVHTRLTFVSFNKYSKQFTKLKEHEDAKLNKSVLVCCERKLSLNMQCFLTSNRIIFGFFCLSFIKASKSFCRSFPAYAGSNQVLKTLEEQFRTKPLLLFFYWLFCFVLCFWLFMLFIIFCKNWRCK